MPKRKDPAKAALAAALKKRGVSHGRKSSTLELSVAAQMYAAGIPSWQTEQLLVRGERKFAYDFSWPEYKVALEVHGGQYQRGRHQTAGGFATDRLKMNLAQLNGWLVIEATTSHVKSGEFIEWVDRALELRDPAWTGG